MENEVVTVDPEQLSEQKLGHTRLAAVFLPFRNPLRMELDLARQRLPAP